MNIPNLKILCDKYPDVRIRFEVTATTADHQRIATIVDIDAKGLMDNVGLDKIDIAVDAAIKELLDENQRDLWII